MVGDLEDRPAVAFAQSALFEHQQDVVGQVEQADQVRDLRAAAADPATEVLFGDTEVLDQGGAGAGLFDRVEVFADHVLDQRHFEPVSLIGVADDHRDPLDPGHLSRPPAPLTGDKFVTLSLSSLTSSGWTTPLAAIESARACSASSLKRRRG